MGEVTHLKANIPKRRPLGLVKRESIHFDNEGNDADVELFSCDNKQWSRGSLAFLGRSKTENDLKHEFRSMRDLQETLRQAALLNIVAAVNHDDQMADTVTTAIPPRTSGGHTNISGIKGASILGHTITRPGMKSIVTSDGISVANFSHNLSSVANMATTSNNSTLSQLLGQRPRTISIPRPRTQTNHSAFMHNTLLDAKEQLTSVTTFRTQSNRGETGFSEYLVTPAEEATPVVYESTNDSFSKLGGVDLKSSDLILGVSGLRGTGFDSGNSPQLSKQGKLDHSVRDSKDTFPNNNYNNTQCADSLNGRLAKEQQRAQNVHQMQVVKRHISTNKKKEMIKKLTDIAKCEAVDIAEPLSSTDAVSAPPIIIMSHPKENNIVTSEDFNAKLNRAKSVTSLNSRGENNCTPANSRINSETHEAMTIYRETKKKGMLKVEEDLIIGGIAGINSSAGVDGLYRTHKDLIQSELHGELTPTFVDSSTCELFSKGIVGKNSSLSFSPDVLELRPLQNIPHTNSRVIEIDRRREHISKRSTNPGFRDKLISPSPAVYEASFHKPKASMGQMTLVGQSFPSLTGNKITSIHYHVSKSTTKRSSVDRSSNSVQDELKTEENPYNKQINQTRPWGSIGKQNSVNSPILRTEIVDHLQCVGLTNQQYQAPHIYKKSSISKINGVNRNLGVNKCEFEFDDEQDYLDDASSDPPRNTKNNDANYRKTKLYNAFRASEENLSTLVDNSSLVSEVMTSRTLFNPQVIEESSPLPSAGDRVNNSTKEPLYMGCSSRVSEKELSSQYHYVNDLEEEEERQGGKFKVMKAIDQDVYFDFQHKKYRKNNETPLNTAPNNPRMHFLKIKFSGETRT